jgi:long-chain acyl-CoA synthetase
MLDLAPYQDLKIAPRAVFDRLDELGDHPRFQVADPNGWRPVTWAAFAAQIKSVSIFLAAEGLVPGDTCAVFAPNRVEWASAALGIQAAGCVMVPIYPSCTAEQAAQVLRDSGAKVAFVDTEALLIRLFQVWETLPALKRVVLLSDDIAPRTIADRAGIETNNSLSHRNINASVFTWSGAMAVGQTGGAALQNQFASRLNAVGLDDPALMLFTSGTSGKPKGVPLTHRNVGINGRDWLECNAPVINEGERDLLWLPFSHIFGFGELCLGNTLGFTTWLSSPACVLDHLPEVSPTVFMSVPSLWEKLAGAALMQENPEAQRKALQSATGGNLRFCLSGGAGLKREVKELFLERAEVLIIEGYGLTEASPTLTLNRPGDFRFDSVGKALPSVELRLAADGEIEASGESIFGGYHNDPEATSDAFTADGWLKTGDLGRFTDDGFLQIIGRKKEILVTAGGKNIPPVNIEIRFMDDALIEHLVVYGDGHKYLVAGVWVNPAQVGDLDGEALIAAVQERIDAQNTHLARHETIKKFVLMESALTVEAGFLTPTLKLKRKAVYEAFEVQLEALYS